MDNENGSSQNGNQPEQPKKPTGRPSKAQLDARAQELNDIEKQLAEKEAEITAKEAEIEAAGGQNDQNTADITENSENGLESHPMDAVGAQENGTEPASASSIAKAFRTGRQRRDPRWIEESRRSPNRLDLGMPDLNLSYKDHTGQLVGYEPRWFVAKPGRIEKKLQQGWEPVYNDESFKVGTGSDDFNENMDSWVSQITGTAEGGQPQRSYLLRMKKELFELYQEEKRRRIEAVDSQIRDGDFEKKSGDGRYVKQIQYTT
jgi:hypothetical protein